VVEPLLDDLNTPVAVSALSAPLKAANDLMTTKAGRKNPKRWGSYLACRSMASLTGRKSVDLCMHCGSTRGVRFAE
jgi:hypothetical protein